MAFKFRNRQTNDNTTLAESRAKAQQAQSAARLSTEPTVKAQWEQLAASWLERVEALEDGGAPAKTIIPSLDGGTDPGK